MFEKIDVVASLPPLTISQSPLKILCAMTVEPPNYMIIPQEKFALHYTTDNLPGFIKLKLAEISSYIKTYPDKYGNWFLQDIPRYWSDYSSEYPNDHHLLFYSPKHFNRNYPEDMTKNVGWKCVGSYYMIVLNGNEHKELC
jgi:aspartyl-tRNA synthetase